MRSLCAYHFNSDGVQAGAYDVGFEVLSSPDAHVTSAMNQKHVISRWCLVISIVEHYTVQRSTNHMDKVLIGSDVFHTVMMNNKMEYFAYQ